MNDKNMIKAIKNTDEYNLSLRVQFYFDEDEETEEEIIGVSIADYDGFENYTIKSINDLPTIFDDFFSKRT